MNRIEKIDSKMTSHASSNDLFQWPFGKGSHGLSKRMDIVEGGIGLSNDQKSSKCKE